MTGAAAATRGAVTAQVAEDSFVPARGLRAGHAQTLAAYFLGGGLPPHRATAHAVALDDGDQIVIHDDVPPGWRDGDRIALLLHGLAGCHRSPYMRRIAGKLNVRGVRSFRMDMRTAGAGRALAKQPYHGGRSPDVRAALQWLAERFPDSPVGVAGFSLGGNVALRVAGEARERASGNLDRVAAVCPPVDLGECVRSLDGPLQRPYDRWFARILHRDIQDWWAKVPDAPRIEFPRMPRRVLEIDELFTAPLCGFKSADDYYEKASSLPLLPAIAIPTFILAAADDPLAPPGPLSTAPLSPFVRRTITRHGGHMGYLGRRGRDPDRRWMDWRIVEWFAGDGS
jgi:predicted alpha/beta-fold hydrolase